MDRRDDERLRALYRETRRAEEEAAGVKAPGFDELRSRSGAARQGRPRFGQAAAALAFVVALVVAGVWLLNFSSTETPELADGQGTIMAEASESVHPEDPAQEAPMASDDDWDDLLEFADEIWEWESPTDFLLL